MRAAIYARKSTDQPGVADEAKSVARQVAHATAYAATQGWTVVDAHIYVDDGISGAEFAKRPGFLRLMNALRPRRAFDVLIMSEESRLGREAIETAYALKQIITAGVRVFYYLDGRERTLDSPTDKVMLSLTAFADELEREKARQRTYDAMRQKAAAGHVTGGRVFGYDNVRRDTGGVVRVINETEAAVVRDIYAQYAQRHGLRQIAHQLNAAGAVCPRSQQGRPNGWSPSSIRELLHRPLYRGEVVWNRTRKRNRWGQVQQQGRAEAEWLRKPAPELRIVPAELARAVDGRLDRNKTQYLRTTGGRLWGRPSGAGESKYLLVGMATCAVCGGGISVRSRSHRHHRAFYYVCTAYHMRGRSVCANGHDLPMAPTNQAVLDTVAAELLSPETVEAVVERAMEALTEAPDREPERVAALRELAAVETELGRLSAAVATGGDVPSLVTAITDRERRRVALTEQIDALNALEAWPRRDQTALARDLHARLTEWRGLFGRHVAQTRQLLRKLLVGKLAIEPQVTAEGRFARITGTGTLEPLVRGICPNLVASPRGVLPFTMRGAVTQTAA